MVQISQHNQLLTVTVEFNLPAEDQDDLIEMVAGFIENFVKSQHGFVSASLHRSKDGEKVLNYAQWTGREAFEAFGAEFREHETGKKILAYDPDITVWDVSHVYET